jgi:16S rRNA (cytosine967-C5)-methyltransferase
MHSHSYLNTSREIIEAYDGSMPLAIWLKQFFKSNKKFGSTDRKQISHACYCFYRLGNAFQNFELEDRMLTGLFLCSASSNKILEELKPEWNQERSLPLVEKINLLSAHNEIKNLFPFSGELSEEIEQEPFNYSFLVQPDLFLRIRPDKKEKVIHQLQNTSIDFDLISNDCIQLPNQSKLDEFSIDEDVVVQDYNSQKVIDVFNNSKPQTPNSKLYAWDCCAASGGKSILFYDRFPNIHLTVSDVRESILINLQKRFKRAGIKNYDHFVADVSSPLFSIQKKFDLVTCDAPCSGSGTWSRTPEQLLFFKKEKINHYSDLQKKIVSNSSKALNNNGHFLYITCSVFRKENEEIVEFIRQHSSLQLLTMKYLKGYDRKADSLFVALFTRI